MLIALFEIDLLRWIYNLGVLYIQKQILQHSHKWDVFPKP